MILHNDSSYNIYFGDLKDDIIKSDGKPNSDYFDKKIQRFGLKGLVFLKQIHSTKGFCLKSPLQFENKKKLFEQEGDFIITNQRNVGIGVLTADCLPVVFYDSFNNAIGIAHVGWKGAISGIIGNILKEFKNCFNTKPEELAVYFGPSARVCCYQISKDFFKKIENVAFKDEIILIKDNQTYFNLPKLVENQLIKQGVLRKEILKDYNSCTICDLRFHSYRRSEQDSGRQATIAYLK